MSVWCGVLCVSCVCDGCVKCTRKVCVLGRRAEFAVCEFGNTLLGSVVRVWSCCGLWCAWGRVAYNCAMRELMCSMCPLKLLGWLTS